jgi:Uma2 family endonuclease
MSSLPVTYLTPEQYLELEREAEFKHEYWDGEMVAMAGGSPSHSIVINTLGAMLYNVTRGTSCRVGNSDLRVCVRWDRLITYPDVTVVCGPLEYAGDRQDTITNPTLVVEVLSPSTADIDRGRKNLLYRQVASMREILLVEPNVVGIEHYWKLPNGHWELETVSDRTAQLKLQSLQRELSVAEIYADVEIR